MMDDSGISVFNNHGIGGIVGNVYAPVVIINIDSLESLAGLESTLHKIIAEFGADGKERRGGGETAMMKCKKIVAPGNAPIEDAINQFFMQEQLSRSDVVHIRPITVNSGGSIPDLWCVYIFYDKYGAAEQAAQ